MILHFRVNGQQISDEINEAIIADSIDYLKASFTFSPEWGGLVKTAIFKTAAGVAYSELLVGNECIVPHEVIRPKYMKVSVFGVTSTGVKRITATERIVHISASGYTDDSITLPPPTPDIYQQMVSVMNAQAVDAARAETAQEEAERAAVAAGLSETNAADSASQAALSVLGGGYVGMEIKSDGKLYCTRTRNLESTLNFALSNGRLEVQING